MAMPSSTAFLNGAAFCMKLSSVHVRPDSQYSTGTGEVEDAVGGRKMAKRIKLDVDDDWWLHFVSQPSHTLVLPAAVSGDGALLLLPPLMARPAGHTGRCRRTDGSSEWWKSDHRREIGSWQWLQKPGWYTTVTASGE